VPFMKNDKFTRRTFIHSAFLKTAGIVAGALATNGCTSRTTTALAYRKPEKPKAVLWIGGHSHDFEAIAKIMTDFLPKQAPIEIEVVRDGSFVDSAGAEHLDVILMNHCYNSAEGVLNEKQKQNLLKLVHDGTGIVAIHASYYSFTDWNEYHDKFFGARFIRHGKVDVILEVTITDKEHPITKNLDDSFEAHSELYQSSPIPKDCRILAYSKEKGQAESFPSVWVNNYGRGRIATILPAHWPDTYRLAAFQRLITASTLWAMRRPEKW